MKGWGRIKKIARNIGMRFKASAVILIYHRVINLSNDPYNLIVSPFHFAEHLTYIKEKYFPMRLIDLVEALDQNSLPKHAVAVTFDDGYEDNFTEALPILEMAQVPATIFVTGNKINDSREFWWDDVERVLLSTKVLPDYLRLYIHGSFYDWKTSELEKRQIAFESIHNKVMLLSSDEREKVIFDLLRWAGLELNGRKNYLPLKYEELKQLKSNNIIDIGAHTLTHPVLSSLSIDEQFAEISGSRKKLESILGIPIKTFAYPYGNTSDYTCDTVQAVQAAAFSAAVTTKQGYVTAGDDVHQLNRCEVRNWDKEYFVKKLDSYFSS